ncbi:Hsp70 family protein [uncultured Rubinisphaera sp.]|uniref:Hsp70 family protein n=2 Tax=Rubinisphaera TaxID=1649490 RepID=UPI0030D7578D|tara:strand:- start:8168 stop:9682 length:1515 start_codon:yes stop_codon:yes gene_type:complete
MKEPAIGIDLGTTFSVVATLDADGKPQTIRTAEGDLTCPSVVLFDENSIAVGQEAVKAATVEAENVADFAKRDIGNSAYHRLIRGESYPPEVIQSLILEKLKRDAEMQVGPFTKAVITVPAFFNEPRRQATADAGELAGIDVIDIINEPTAAALVYGIQQGFLNKTGEANQSERILVYDLGGGTFDVTLMEVSGHQFNTLGTAGDVYLGGTDWDRRIVDLIAEKFQQKFRGIDPRQDPKGMKRLHREAEDAKRALSVRGSITITFEHAGEGLRLPISREDFESCTADLLERTIFTTTNLLRDVNVQISDLTRILLVGGSTRMPAIAERLQKETGLIIDRSLSADEAVAHGAALYAGFLLDKQQNRPTNVTITNVNSHSLGLIALKREQKVNSILIPKNTSLPVTRTKRFKTHKDNQRTVIIRVVEGDDPSGENVTEIGKCVLGPLPTGLSAGTRVDVAFSYNESGRLTVVAQIPSIGLGSKVAIERSEGLSADQKAKWQTRMTQ